MTKWSEKQIPSSNEKRKPPLEEKKDLADAPLYLGKKTVKGSTAEKAHNSNTLRAEAIAIKKIIRRLKCHKEQESREKNG